MTDPFEGKRFHFTDSRMVLDPYGEYVRYDDALIHGSEERGIGRQEGQVDSEAVAKILKASYRPDPMSLRLD